MASKLAYLGCSFKRNATAKAQTMLGNALRTSTGLRPLRSENFPVGIARMIKTIAKAVPIKPISIYEAPRLLAYKGMTGVAIPIASESVKMNKYTATKLMSAVNRVDVFRLLKHPQGINSRTL